MSQPSFGRAAFVAGTDGGIWWSTQTTAWRSLGAPPGGLLGAPAAVSWADRRIDVFVRGTDNRLWQQFTTCGGCQWSGWAKPVGDGVLASSPTVTSWGAGRLDVFVLGTDGAIHQRFWDTSSWSGAWAFRGAPSPGASMNPPAAASWGIGRIDVFVEGDDHRLWQTFMDGSAWSGWSKPPGTEQGTLASAPAASPWGQPQHWLTVFTRGTDNRVYQTTWTGGWSGWAVLGAPQDFIVGAPGAVTNGSSNPYVLARGLDDRAWAYLPPGLSTDASGATQQVVVSAPNLASRSGTLTAYQYADGIWRVAYGPFVAQLGYNGLSDNRSEGDGTTPTGTYGFGTTMYGIGVPLNSRFAYHHLVCGDWWSGEHDSTYNQYRFSPCGQNLSSKSEALWRQTTAYQHFAVVNFNVSPTIVGRGSGIFLHDDTTSGFTAGCIALPAGTLEQVLGWLDPAQHPVIRIGTTSEVGPPG